MVNVNQTTRAQIDRLLDATIEAWESLPSVASEIDSWDLLDQLEFTESWSVQEQRLQRIEYYAEAGMLTPEQHDRYDKLQRTVNQNRSILLQIMSN